MHPFERGNAFMIILVAVILFAALMFAFSRGMNTGTTRLTSAEARALASDAINYAQALERAVGHLLQSGVSEGDVSFENDLIAGYAHAPAASDNAQVFNTSTGGGMDVKKPLPGQTPSTSNIWLYTGAVLVTSQEDNSKSELLATLPVSYDICVEMNKQLGVTIDLTSDLGTVTGTKFTGTYMDDVTNVINPGTGLTSGCFKGLITNGTQTGSYTFFKVLIAR